MFKSITGADLNLRNPKTFNEKIQWLKLYDTFPLKTQLTDKVLVRDYIKDKIGEEYLKPVFQICKTFDDINWENLPESFIIKANHGCKWHYKIKKKTDVLNNPDIYGYLKRKFDGWQNINFFPWAGFEMQYKDIVPQILVEKLLLQDVNDAPVEYEIFCFNGVPKIYQKIVYSHSPECSVYEQDFSLSDVSFNFDYIVRNEKADIYLKTCAELSEILAKDFKLVRVDWMLFEDKVYFNEMTFTPYSGFYPFRRKEIDERLGSMLNIH